MDFWTQASKTAPEGFQTGVTSFHAAERERLMAQQEAEAARHNQTMEGYYQAQNRAAIAKDAMTQFAARQKADMMAKVFPWMTPFINEAARKGSDLNAQYSKIHGDKEFGVFDPNKEYIDSDLVNNLMSMAMLRQQMEEKKQANLQFSMPPITEPDIPGITQDVPLVQKSTAPNAAVPQTAPRGTGVGDFLMKFGKEVLPRTILPFGLLKLASPSGYNRFVRSVIPNSFLKGSPVAPSDPGELPEAPWTMPRYSPELVSQVGQSFATFINDIRNNPKLRESKQYADRIKEYAPMLSLIQTQYPQLKSDPVFMAMEGEVVPEMLAYQRKTLEERAKENARYRQSVDEATIKGFMQLSGDKDILQSKDRGQGLLQNILQGRRTLLGQ